MRFIFHNAHTHTHTHTHTRRSTTNTCIPVHRKDHRCVSTSVPQQFNPRQGVRNAFGVKQALVLSIPRLRFAISRTHLTQRPPPGSATFGDGEQSSTQTQQSFFLKEFESPWCFQHHSTLALEATRCDLTLVPDPHLMFTGDDGGFLLVASGACDRDGGAVGFLWRPGSVGVRARCRGLRSWSAVCLRS